MTCAYDCINECEFYKSNSYFEAKHVNISRIYSSSGTHVVEINIRGNLEERETAWGRGGGATLDEQGRK